MQKIVINRCYGGFGLSKEAMVEYVARKGTSVSEYDIMRDDSDLVAVVEEFGRAANGPHANLAVVEIPDAGCGPA
jgi:hypothetical protein